ncbi:hypothetical protein [Pseudomonas prosekii]|uniref:hypothetical protein n=1 Tax=Pseudomonas prosekii TaxID=1148509 RepID=UPI003F74DD1B
MTDYAELKRLVEQGSLPPIISTLIAENERLSGLQPSFPPRPPEGEGLPRFGLRWNSPQQPLAVAMADGYWTPWHLAEQLRAQNAGLKTGYEAYEQTVKELRAELEALRKDAERYRWLHHGHSGYIEVVEWIGPHATGMTGEDLDALIDAAMGKGEQS